ncbi:CHAT domain-containing protein [Mycena sp. CBHHK59/15]|nr:CHAT domain-containing protein [Mycena sp. CBHHK59/15]
MSKIIHLNRIYIRSLTNPHDDLPKDMQMFAQVIIDKSIFLQTVPVEAEESQTSWELDFGCKIQPHILMFSVVILRHSQTGGTRLLGYVEIKSSKFLDLSKLIGVVFCIQLKKVNPDGPLFEFTAGFEMSEAAPIISGFNRLERPENKSAVSVHHPVPSSELSTVVSVKSRTIPNDLQEMYDQASGSVHSLELWVMHERILLLPHGNPNRAHWLNILGDILFNHYGASGTVDVLGQAVCAYRDALRDDVGNVIYITDLGKALVKHFVRLGQLADIDEAVRMWEAALRLTPDGHCGKLALFSNLGNSSMLRFERLGELTDLNRAVNNFEAAASINADGDPERPLQLTNLGGCLSTRFERLGERDDLDQAMRRFMDALRLTPDGHPDRPLRLSNLGQILLQRFEQLGKLTDLNKAVNKFEAAVSLTPDDHPARPSILNNLGRCLRRRFEQFGELTDIDQAMLSFQEALRLTPDGHPDRPLRLNDLGKSLTTRFMRLGELTDINQAVAKLEAALRLTPDDHLARPSILNNLGNSLSRRFGRLCKIQDINQAVSQLEAAVSLTPEGHRMKPTYLGNLGDSLLQRFERLGELTDLNQAVAKLETVVSLTPDGDPAKPSSLYILGHCLITQFGWLGGLAALNQAVVNFEAALRLTQDGDPEKPARLGIFGGSLFTRFKQLGEIADINQAVAKLDAAVSLTPNDHPEKVFHLCNLGSCLRSRFEWLGDLADIGQATSKFEDALRLTPDGHPDKPSRLGNLGGCLTTRFERLGDLVDINRAILMLETAIVLTPDDHPEKPSYLTNLGIQYSRSFSGLVTWYEDTLRITPDGHPDKPSYLANLASSLLLRFERLGDMADLNESVSRLKSALEITPEHHPNRPLLLNNLGHSLASRFEHLHHVHDFDEMLLQYSSAASSMAGPARTRFNASTMWAKHAQTHHHPSLLQAYGTALELLPELAWLGLSIGDRHDHIRQAGEVVRDAAAAAIVAHEYEKAVEWLEQGRSVIWGQVLSLRTPMDDLKTSYPALADELIHVSTLLATASLRRPSQSLQSIAQESHTFADERNQLLKQIRELPGFERFLLPKGISELLLAATVGPVVLLNVSEYGCDALILMQGLADEVIHVPLPEFTVQKARLLGESLGLLVQGAARSDRLVGFQEGHVPPDEEFAQILSDLWMQIVKPVLDGLAFTIPCKDPDHRHVSGGLYGRNETFGSKLSDFVVSSYTPSLATLIEGLRARNVAQEGLQILAVAQPAAVGQGYIPGTLKEVDHIQRLAGDIQVLHLDEEVATVNRVQDGMRTSRWAHFACHGVQDISNPTESALLLAGSSRMTLSSIIQLSLPHADLSFLSACQTATGSKTSRTNQFTSRLLKRCISRFGSFGSSPEERNHSLTGCHSYMLGSETHYAVFLVSLLLSILLHLTQWFEKSDIEFCVIWALCWLVNQASARFWFLVYTLSDIFSHLSKLDLKYEDADTGSLS